jgi:hypothetical protein
LFAVKDDVPVPPLLTLNCPVTPVDKGKLSQFERVPDVGVPRTPPLTTTAPAEPVLTARAVATFVPRPEMPVDTGRPVQEVSVPDAGVPKAGAVKVGDAIVGEVPNTNAPEPVSSVTAAAKFALDGVARNVAIPVPRPEMPVDTGRPVQEVSVPDAGVPKTGVVKVGDAIVGLLDKTTLPEPVLVVTPVPPFRTFSVPERVTAPVVAVLGVKPVVPALKELTAPAKDGVIRLYDEYHCVVLEALKIITPLTAI